MGVDEKSFQPDDHGWRENAACLGVGPELFYSYAKKDVMAALKICGECAVKDQCLEYALKNKEEYGVWGGYAEEDRKQLRKEWLKKQAS